MFLYHVHDMQSAAMAPWRLAAEAAHCAFQSPLFPPSHTPFGRAISASAEIFERSTRYYAKPSFNLTTIKLRGQPLVIEQECVVTKPFCRLLHFKRISKDPDISAQLARDPRVLIIAPLAGNFATLLRGTVEAMLPEHDVYITDWADAKMVPLMQGDFDLEDNIDYILEFIKLLGPDVHVMAVCQPSVPALCATALLAESRDRAQPRSLILLGGPIDARAARSPLTEVAATHSLDWFRNTVIQAVPFYYPGAFRLVYPGFLQLSGFMSMHMDRHFNEQLKMFQHMVRGDDDAANNTRRFYDEYLAVMDVTAEYYLQTVERVFQNYDLCRGTFRWKDRCVDLDAIEETALLAVEGEMDDITPPGQTRAALDFCRNLATDKKRSYLQIGVGHFGVFNGRKWRNAIQPVVRQFILEHNEIAQ